ncbi:hypothetical protein [uncultured Duncaniella sp.]|uniref:hypothetical protein n=1 Tax=uncultured Duncaniella sp. TaxID=2768039 RepID=UPI0026023894|nr:hypothetical protein [uncultured Duncaniella sp.]
MSLSSGQTLVLTDFLRDYVAHDTFDPRRDILLSSDDIAFMLQSMCEFDKNQISDFMADNGYRYARLGHASEMAGWILEHIADEPDDD